MFLSENIVERLRAGSGLIVPTRSRAAAVRLAYARWQLQSTDVWPTPNVLAENGWLASLARELYLQGEGIIRRPLVAHEEWCLWHDAASELLADREDPRPFIWSADALADALQRAARLCGEWRIDDATLARHATAETEWLLRARQRVSHVAHDLEAMASFELGAELLSHMGSAERIGRDCGHTYLGGVISPLMRALFAARRVDAIQSVSGAAARVTHHIVPSAAEEIATAARWARHRLEQDPGARLYVVVPALEARRAEVERCFSSELTPSRWRESERETLFDIEGGRPLADYAEPRQVLQLLRWLASFDEAQAFANLLESDLFSDLSVAPRARLAVPLRRYPTERRSAIAWIRLLGEVRTGVASDSSIVDVVQQRLDQWQSQFQRDELSWADRFAVIAQQAVFDRRPARDSTLRQIREQWRDLIQVFRDVERSRRTSHGREVVALLAALAQREFVAPSRGELPVTITRSLDHPAVRYDGIYVCGLQADAWPAPARADPFVPYLLQRALGVPESTALGQSMRAQLAMRQWSESTADLHYSSAKRDGETELQPSPLLRDIPVSSESSPTSFARRLRGQNPVLPQVEPADVKGLPWNPQRRLPGGAETLATQALCDFRAYAERRLLGRQEEDADPGISALVRGSLLHRALHILWGELIDSDRLRALSAPELETAIEASIVAAMADPSLSVGLEGASAAARQQLLAREQRRSGRVIRRLLELEQQRAPFSVEFREHPVSLTLGEARIELRIDRIDRVSGSANSSGLLILDYKSGRYRSLKFSLSELDAVQLWLYALCVESQSAESIVALANVHLSSSGCRYVAATDDGELLPRVKPGVAWRDQREHVRTEIETLAARFMQGAAMVRPSQRACQYCDLAGLCRRAELAGSGAIGTELEEGAE